jgi:hypothetical protein
MIRMTQEDFNKFVLMLAVGCTAFGVIIGLVIGLLIN